jgi:hypothetical protein
MMFAGVRHGGGSLLLGALGLVLTVAVIAGRPARPTYLVATGTITEVGPSFGCGVFVGVTQIRYGDHQGVLVPCIEFQRAKGLRFAVGDVHRLIIDGHDRVRAIEWNDRWYPLDGFPAVKPPPGIGSVRWSTSRERGGSTQVHDSAPGWHGDEPTRD